MTHDGTKVRSIADRIKAQSGMEPAIDVAFYVYALCGSSEPRALVSRPDSSSLPHNGVLTWDIWGIGQNHVFMLRAEHTARPPYPPIVEVKANYNFRLDELPGLISLTDVAVKDERPSGQLHVMPTWKLSVNDDVSTVCDTRTLTSAQGREAVDDFIKLAFKAA